MTPGIAIGIGKTLFGVGQTIFGSKIKPQFSQYTANNNVKDQLGIAKQLYNGRMAGASGVEKNIYNTQANTVDAIGRNATDSSQSLAMIAGAQGQANEGFNQLGINEAQNKYSLIDNLNKGYAAMTQEGDKEYQSKLFKYQQDMEARSKMMGGGIQNMFGGLNDIASFDFLNKQLGAGKAPSFW